MRNPYFFVFLLSFFYGGSPYSVFAKTTSKLTPSNSSQNLKSGASKNTASKTSASTKKTTPSAKATSKIQVDLNTVPVMGSYDPSSTEAGVTVPGIVSGPAPAVPYRSYSTSNYQDPVNVGMTSMGGILNLFTMAQQVGKIVNPNAVMGPMFIGECKDCAGKKNTAGAPDVVTSEASPNITPVSSPTNFAISRPQSSSVAQGSGPGGGEVASGSGEDFALSGGEVVELEDIEPRFTFNSEPHMKIINSENFRPFEGAKPSDMYIAFGGSAAYQELTKVMSEAEMSSMCSNFLNLNISQQETLMMYVYSEILKQTSGYQSYRVTLTPVPGGKQIESYGMCQLSLAQAKELKQSYPNSTLASLPVNSEEALQSFIMDKGHVIEADICALKILKEALKDNSSGSMPLQRTFPKVDFNKVNAKLNTLKMCARPANA